MNKYRTNPIRIHLTIIISTILLASLPVHSQISINNEDFKKIFSPSGFHYYTEGTEGNFNIGNTGGPNVYDFTNISLQNLLISNNYEVSTIPELAKRYPETAFTFGDSPTTIEKNPVFLITPDTAYNTGQATLAPVLEFVHYRPHEVVIVFPATYGDGFSQQIEKFDTTFNSSGQVVSTDYSTSNEVTTADGYGILKLSGHQFNCIRVKKEHNGYGDKEYIYLTHEGATVLVGGVSLSSPDTGFVTGFGQVLLPSSVADARDKNELSFSFKLEQNFPNPFNPTTKIFYTITKSEFISLKVYDILGKEITTLVNEQKSAGDYEIDFDAKNLASGTYFYKLQSSDNLLVRKMVVLK